LLVKNDWDLRDMEAKILTLEINEQERELLLEITKAEHSSLLDEIHHTESYDYKQMLKQKDELLKNLRSKIEAIVSDNKTI
jgi:hypothetical protein